MKKGNGWPKARARWLMTDVDQLRLNAPVWVFPFEVNLVIVLDFEGLPIPVNIVGSDLSLGLWRYRPSDGAIVWRGEWNTFLGGGLWFIEQYTANDEWVYRRMTLRYTSGGVDSDIVLDDSSVRTHGEWGVILPSYVRFDPVLTADAPWLPTGWTFMEAAAYGTLRSFSLDPDNTEPATWNYTGLH